MADEPVSADGAMISVERLARAGKHAEKHAEKGVLVSVSLNSFGIAVSAWNRAAIVEKYGFAAVSWQSVTDDGVLKAAIDRAVARL